MRYIIVLALVLAAMPAAAQDFTFEQFVGTWTGTISSELTFGYNDPITLVISGDGVYDDSTGRLMPDLYPDTQVASHDAATNRVQFRYLDIVYAGQYFYESIWFEIAAYTGDYLELHYNFWDDPEPHPQVQKLVLTRQGSSGLAGVPGVAGAARLEPNFPNPFNPATTLAFTLEQDGPALLEIFDQRGRRVAVLADGELAAGRHEIAWRAEVLPSGVYLSRLTAGGASSVRTLTLVK
jgi:hypothetical protein